MKKIILPILFSLFIISCSDKTSFTSRKYLDGRYKETTAINKEKSIDKAELNGTAMQDLAPVTEKIIQNSKSELNIERKGLVENENVTEHKNHINQKTGTTYKHVYKLKKQVAIRVDEKPQGASSKTPTEEAYNLAVASIVCLGVSLLGTCASIILPFISALSFPLLIVALVLGVIALKKSKKLMAGAGSEAVSGTDASKLSTTKTMSLISVIASSVLLFLNLLLLTLVVLLILGIFGATAFAFWNI